MESKNLVLIGGGHAHMVTLAQLKSLVGRGHRVTVIQPAEHHYYSGMGPGMLGGTYAPDEIRFHTRKVVTDQGGVFIKDKAQQIDPQRQLVRLEQSGEEIPYDVLSCNAGSNVPRSRFNTVDNVFAAKPIEGLLRARQEIIRLGQTAPLEIAVVGGGPSGVEIAGNLRQLAGQADLRAVTIRVFAGRRLMKELPDRIGALVRKNFAGRNIEVIEGAYVEEVERGKVHLGDGRTFKADLIFPAVGVEPSPLFAESGLPTGPDGGLLVNAYLQSTVYPNIFGGGDAIYFQPQPLDKVGVYAVRQNPVLYHNLAAALDGGQLQAFDPGGNYLLIYNLGGGNGIFCKWPFIFSGKLAFTIKDWIDRRFIDKFQAIEL